MNCETIFQALSGEDSRCSFVSNRWGELTHLSNFCIKVNLCLLSSSYLFGFKGGGSFRDMVINKEQNCAIRKDFIFLEISCKACLIMFQRYKYFVSFFLSFLSWKIVKKLR